MICTDCKGDFPEQEFYSGKTKRPRCSECRRKLAKQVNRQQYEKNIEKRKAYSRAWHEANREYAVAKMRERYKRADKVALREQGRAYHSENKTRINQQRRERFSNPCSPRRVSNALRRAMTSGANGSVTASEWAQILECHDHRCAYCLRKGEALEMDHVVALSRGGEHNASNIVPACKQCNLSKKDHSLLELFQPHLVIAQRMRLPAQQG